MELRWPTWIGVVVDDLEKQRRFYRDALGFRETASSEGWVHLEFPGGGLFELVQRAPVAAVRDQALPGRVHRR